MIPLAQVEKPRQLTDELVAELTKEYAATGKRVWAQDWLKGALLVMGRNKCAFCECNVTSESKYLEVDHYLPKSLYPDRVLDWENLLPTCKRCNARKLNHDTGSKPLVNPRFQEPKMHFCLKGYELRGTTAAGELTETVILLNENDRLVTERVKIGEGIKDTLVDLLNELIDIGTTNQRLLEKLVRQFKAMLMEAQPETEYAGITSTVLLSMSEYERIKDILASCQLWSDELTRLESQAKEIALPLA